MKYWMHLWCHLVVFRKLELKTCIISAAKDGFVKYGWRYSSCTHGNSIGNFDKALGSRIISLNHCFILQKKKPCLDLLLFRSHWMSRTHCLLKFLKLYWTVQQEDTQCHTTGQYAFAVDMQFSMVFRRGKQDIMQKCNFSYEVSVTEILEMNVYVAKTIIKLNCLMRAKLKVLVFSRPPQGWHHHLKDTAVLALEKVLWETRTLCLMPQGCHHNYFGLGHNKEGNQWNSWKGEMPFPPSCNHFLFSPLPPLSPKLWLPSLPYPFFSKCFHHHRRCIPIVNSLSFNTDWI